MQQKVVVGYRTTAAVMETLAHVHKAHTLATRSTNDPVC